MRQKLLVLEGGPGVGKTEYVQAIYGPGKNLEWNCASCGKSSDLSAIIGLYTGANILIQIFTRASNQGWAPKGFPRASKCAQPGASNGFQGFSEPSEALGHPWKPLRCVNTSLGPSHASNWRTPGVVGRPKTNPRPEPHALAPSGHVAIVGSRGWEPLGCQRPLSLEVHRGPLLS